MAETYFVVDQASAANGTTPVPMEALKAKTLERPQRAFFVKMEAENVKEAQEAYAQMFPGNSNGTPVVVTSAQWKSS